MFHLFIAFVVIVVLIGLGFGRIMAKVLLVVVGIPAAIILLIIIIFNGPWAKAWETPAQVSQAAPEDPAPTTPPAALTTASNNPPIEFEMSTPPGYIPPPDPFLHLPGDKVRRWFYYDGSTPVGPFRSAVEAATACNRARAVSSSSNCQLASAVCGPADEGKGVGVCGWPYLSAAVEQPAPAQPGSPEDVVLKLGAIPVTQPAPAQVSGAAQAMAFSSPGEA